MKCRKLQDFLANPTAQGYTTLDLNLRNIGPEGGVAIGRALESNNTLQRLSLGSNNIDSNGAILIGRALESNNILQELALYHNNIGPDGAVAIARALEFNQTLQILNLAKTNIGSNGAVAIGRALESNNTLQRLNLRYNNIGPDGAAAIGHSLESNNTLQALELYNNNIGNNGTVEIIRSIARNNDNTSLSYLNLSANQITRLPAELAQCTGATLTTFYYYDNPIDDYIPPSVQRWLDRFQQQQNAQIYQDSQNVHNLQIQQCIKDSLNRIINSYNGPPKYKSFEEVRNVIVNDSILTPQCKTQLIEYASDQTDVHTGLGVTFAEALQYVFARIEMNEHKDGIKDVLNKEMSDALCKCFTGRISRLIDCLNGIDNLVMIDLSPNQRINSICQQIYELLSQEGEAFLTAENYQARVEKELNERGFDLTKEIQTQYIDPILQDL